MANVSEVKKKILKMIPDDFGKPFEELKKEILQNEREGRCGASDHFDSGNGYRIFHTSNTNFMQGSHNGGGAGFFARLQGVGMVRDIKISE